MLWLTSLFISCWVKSVVNFSDHVMLGDVVVNFSVHVMLGDVVVNFSVYVMLGEVCGYLLCSCHAG